MRVKVKVYVDLQRYNPDKGEEFTVEIKEGSRVKDLMQLLQLPEHRVMLILKNERIGKEEDLLVDGDAISFLPVVGGG
ncbi:MAG: MoaD/ThiS family protein [Syntrophaceae bacterium]|nr:MoaD/ThiS family protein [Syntrophaceae bacterium]